MSGVFRSDVQKGLTIFVARISEALGNKLIGIEIDLSGIRRNADGMDVLPLTVAISAIAGSTIKRADALADAEYDALMGACVVIEARLVGADQRPGPGHVPLDVNALLHTRRWAEAAE